MSDGYLPAQFEYCSSCGFTTRLIVAPIRMCQCTKTQEAPPTTVIPTAELEALRARVETAERQAREANSCSAQMLIALQDVSELTRLEGEVDDYSEVPKAMRDRLTELERDAAKYYQLLYAVQTKHPDESRHETALRYIRNAENQCHGPQQAIDKERG